MKVKLSIGSAINIDIISRIGYSYQKCSHAEFIINLVFAPLL